MGVYHDKVINLNSVKILSVFSEWFGKYCCQYGKTFFKLLVYTLLMVCFLFLRHSPIFADVSKNKILNIVTSVFISFL